MTNITTIQATVYALLAEQFCMDQPEEITPELTLSRLGADSLDMAEIMVELEEKFGIEINADELYRVETVGQIVELVERERLRYDH